VDMLAQFQQAAKLITSCQGFRLVNCLRASVPCQVDSQFHTATQCF